MPRPRCSANAGIFPPASSSGCSPAPCRRTFCPYQAREVAALAERAWSLLAIRAPGTSKIRFETPAGTIAGDRLKDISVLEIVNDDMPFLVDSVMAELAERAVDVRLVVHPVFAVARDPEGRLLDFKGMQAPRGSRESFIHIHVARIDDDAQRSAIVAALEQVLADIRLCVQDWRPMMGHLGEIIADLKESPPPLAPRRGCGSGAIPRMADRQ